MDVLEQREAYEEINDSYRFTHTAVVGPDEQWLISRILGGSSLLPLSMEELRLEDLQEMIEIPATAYCPFFSPQYSSRASQTRCRPSRTSSGLRWFRMITGIC